MNVFPVRRTPNASHGYIGILNIARKLKAGFMALYCLKCEPNSILKESTQISSCGVEVPNQH